jgi:hypothetical protein
MRDCHRYHHVNTTTGFSAMEKSKSKASIDSNEWLSSKRLLQRHKLNYEQNITLPEHDSMWPPP